MCLVCKDEKVILAEVAGGLTFKPCPYCNKKAIEKARKASAK